MTTLITPAKARAYVYHGQWVGDCPRDECANAEFLFDREGHRKAQYYCTYCHTLSEIEWAADELDIMTVLMRRPLPHTRNWYPLDHDVAVRASIPHGQSVAQLIAESHEHGVD